MREVTMCIVHGKMNTLEPFHVDNPVVIPRIGERINVFFTPAPTVTQVGYEYTEDKVFVAVEVE